MTARIVAVDVGNSAVKLQAFQQQPRRPTVAQQAIAVGNDRPDWADAIRNYRDALAAPATQPPADDQPPGAAVDGFPAGAAGFPGGIGFTDRMVWRVASVNRPASDRLQQLVQQHFPHDQWHTVTWRDVPLRIDVHQPQVVGIDRLVAGWAAWRRIASDVVVVDAGSAVTVDLIDCDGTFRGGAILPGFALQYRSLAVGTAALPELVDPPGQPNAVTAHPSGPGRDTAQAIRLGVTTGIVAGIERLAEIYQATMQSPRTLPMVLTGGDALRLAPWLRPAPLVVPGLVVEGLAELP